MTKVMLLTDGDRRWARERGLPVKAGYDQMSSKVAWCAEMVSARGIAELYVPVCSIENLKRPPEEVDAFLTAMLDCPRQSAIPLHLTVTGNLAALPNDYQRRFEELAKRHQSGFPVRLLLAWSLHDEILRLVNKFRGSAEEITAGQLARAADISATIDLIIRTGRVRRMSSFVPFTSPYAELCFLDIYFPDITEQHIDYALSRLAAADRRYGR